RRCDRPPDAHRSLKAPAAMRGVPLKAPTHDAPWRVQYLFDFFVVLFSSYARAMYDKVELPPARKARPLCAKRPLGNVYEGHFRTVRAAFAASGDKTSTQTLPPSDNR